MKERINTNGDSVGIFNVGIHSQLGLPIENTLAMFHADAERQTEEIAVNLGIKTLGDVLFFLIRLGKGQLSSGNKLLHEGA
jgi:hypothetical protein